MYMTMPSPISEKRTRLPGLTGGGSDTPACGSIKPSW
jgi:hypothetical protein